MVRAKVLADMEIEPPCPVVPTPLKPLAPPRVPLAGLMAMLPNGASRDKEPPLPDVAAVADMLARLDMVMPPFKLVMEIEPPLPVPAALAVIPPVTPLPPALELVLKVVALLVTIVIEPPEPVPTPLALKAADTERLPGAAVPAVSDNVPPLPLVGAMVKLLEGAVIVKFCPADSVTFPPSTAAPLPPVALMSNCPFEEPMAIEPVAPSVVIETVPPEPLEPPFTLRS